MKTYQEVKIPERTSQQFVKMTCDLCGKESQEEDGWSNDVFNVSEVRVKHRRGNSYPECGVGTTYFYDLCSGCFWNKIVPWLKEQGCEVQKENWGF